MDDHERAAFIGLFIGLFLGAAICMGGQIVWMEYTEEPKHPAPAIVIEPWDWDTCLVSIDNGEEKAPLEAPMDCKKAQEEYPQATYREL